MPLRHLLRPIPAGCVVFFECQTDFDLGSWYRPRPMFSVIPLLY